MESPPIRVDPRAGSDKFLAILRSFGVPVLSETLEFGDMFLFGNGPDGQSSLTIGIEHKRLPDIIDCISTHRFVGHQLPGLQAQYHIPILMIEGIYRENPTNGALEWIPDTDRQRLYKIPHEFAFKPFEFRRKPMMYRDFANHLNTLRYCAKIEVRNTSRPTHSGYEIAALWHWWNDKAFDEHQSHVGHYDRASQLRVTVPLVQKVAMQIAGIGFKRSGAVARRFKTVTAMVNSKWDDWVGEKNGIGISAVTAKRVLWDLNSEK